MVRAHDGGEEVSLVQFAGIDGDPRGARVGASGASTSPTPTKGSESSANPAAPTVGTLISPPSVNGEKVVVWIVMVLLTVSRVTS